eukprot:gene28602-31771_t
MGQQKPKAGAGSAAVTAAISDNRKVGSKGNGNGRGGSSTRWDKKSKGRGRIRNKKCISGNQRLTRTVMAGVVAARDGAAATKAGAGSAAVTAANNDNRKVGSKGNGNGRGGGSKRWGSRNPKQEQGRRIYAQPRKTPMASRASRRSTVKVSAHKVEIIHEGKTHVLEVGEDETILTVALDNGVNLPHDCTLGVCMTCPAKMISGAVNQSGSMLSEEIAGKGYVLTCVATPTQDCVITTIDEDCVITTIDEGCVITTIDEDCKITTIDEDCVITTIDEDCKITTIDEMSLL